MRARLGSLVVCAAGAGLIVSTATAGAARPSFADRVVAGVPAGPPTEFVIGDLNGDGRPDLASASSGSNRITVITRRADGSGWNAPATITPAGAGQINSLALGDLDGDGRNDLAAADGTGVSVVLRRADGTGWQAATRTGSVGTFPRDLVIGDADGDGRNDLAVADTDGDRAIVVLRNPANTGWLAPTTAAATGRSPSHIAIGDVDGDGRADLVTSDALSGGLTVVLRRTDDVGWRAPTAVPTSRGPGSVAIGDVDGDGRADLVTTDARNGRAIVVARRPDGTGWLAPESAGATGENPASIAIGDLNADGRPDLATSDLDGDSVTVIARRSDGTGWTSPAGFATGEFPYYVRIADLDGDGLPDLATADVADGTAGTISVLTNTTDLIAPTTTDDVPAIAAAVPVTVTLTATDAGGSGVERTWFRVVAADGTVGPERPYDPTARPTLGHGERLRYASVDVAGNEEPVRESAAVRLPDPPAPDPPAPDPPASDPALPAPVVPVPSPPPPLAPPIPPAPSPCQAPFVSLIDIRSGGTARRPRAELVGVAAPSLVGRRVTVHRDGRAIGSTRVAAGGAIRARVAAPRAAAERSRYRLDVDDVRSLSLKAGRRAVLTRQRPLSGGRLRVEGRSGTATTRRTLTVEGRPVCGDQRPSTPTVRTVGGRFSVVLNPPTGTTTAIVYRVRDPRGTVTLPILVTRR